jgi:hypothetical protein
MAETASAIADVFTNFIQFSQVLIGDERSGNDCTVRRDLTCSSPRLDCVANGACAMQAGPCGVRAEISGSFRETLATGLPHMRQTSPSGDAIHENSAKLPFDTVWPASAAGLPFERRSVCEPSSFSQLRGRLELFGAMDPVLFCRKTARYYHRRFSTT